jgi:hypothetical protein
VTDYLRMINPTTSVATEDEAATAARAGAIAAFLLAASGAMSGLIMIATADSYAAKLRRVTEAMYGAGSEAAQAGAGMMTPALVYMSAAMSLIFAVGLLVLGVVQWRKLTRPIPLILGLFTAYSLLMFVLNQVNGNAAVAAMEFPIWRQALAVIVDLAVIVLSYAGFRGASRLAKLRKAAA